jgi:hypothetical protein
MEPLGILLYGYTPEDSQAILNLLEQIVNDKIILISGSGKEEMKVIDILEQGPRNEYIEKENKIMVFLGFSEEQVGAVLNKFPKNDKLKRPIFCGLTEQNIGWTLNYLIEHLLEEDKYWNDKNRSEDLV